jgi:hypothetical protein
MNGPSLRACARCEQEHGILDRTDPRKTHGDCRRHFIETLRKAGSSDQEIEQAIASMSDHAFCPDLGPVQ